MFFLNQKTHLLSNQFLIWSKMPHPLNKFLPTSRYFFINEVKIQNSPSLYRCTITWFILLTSLGNLPRVLKVTSAVYTCSVVNYDFSYFSLKSQVRILKPNLEHYRGSPMLPSQIWDKSVQVFKSYDRNYKQTDKQRLQFFRGVKYFHKGIFPRVTFQVITSQMCNFPKVRPSEAPQTAMRG